MSEWLQWLVGLGGLLATGVAAFTGLRVYQGGRQERRQATADALAARADERDERMLDRLEAELTSMRAELKAVWVALNGYRYREYIWQSVRHGDTLQILDLGGVPVQLPAALLVLPEFPVESPVPPTSPREERT